MGGVAIYVGGVKELIRVVFGDRRSVAVFACCLMETKSLESGGHVGNVESALAAIVLRSAACSMRSKGTSRRATLPGMGIIFTKGALKNLTLVLARLENTLALRGTAAWITEVVIIHSAEWAVIRRIRFDEARSAPVQVGRRACRTKGPRDVCAAVREIWVARV